jgi:hypothetical protein
MVPFHRTAKGGSGTRHGFPALWEATFGELLLAGAAILLATNRNRIHETYLLAAVLGIQSLPFLSAVAIALLEGTGLNHFNHRRRAEMRTAERLRVAR